MKVEKVPFKDAVLVRLNPGDDLLVKIREAVKEHDIKNAVILAGVGSVISHHFHVVASTSNPPKEYFSKGEAAADIVNINGMIINGRVHAHITFSNEKVAYGGHLELGCEVLTFSVIVLAEMDTNFEKWDGTGAIEELL
jgi:predicted DNA-binding protein with PD1-like motif